MNFRDVELLSAYLDGQLSPSDAARLESRLASEPELRTAIAELRGARSLLRGLPVRRAPRNFSLHPTMKRLDAPVPVMFPVLRLAGVLASLLFLATIAVNSLAPLAATHLAAAPASSYGIGGGGGPTDSGTPAAESAPQALSAQAATATTTASPPQKAVPLTNAARSAYAPPVPALWQSILGTLAIICAGLAWYLRRRSRRDFRSRWSQK